MGAMQAGPMGSGETRGRATGSVAAVTSHLQRPPLLHYSHHSLGLGHLVRSLAIAGELADRFRVVLCSGGPVPAGVEIPPGVELVELPPIGVGPDGKLASLDGSAPLDQAWERRRERLLSLEAQLEPVAIVVELFPFGRAKFARELVPLLDAARSRDDGTVVVSSVRDLLVTDKRDQRAHDDLAAARLDRHFDAVVVHADERFVRLEDTFRPAAWPGTPVLYSGFVARSAERPPRRLRRPPEVLVSVGGGATGAPLLRAAAAAHRHELGLRGFRTRLVTGPFLAERDGATLRELAADSPGLTVERLIPDLCAAMAGAAVSVSQCGYNTTLDVLRSGAPAVVVPYAEGRENEQPERARRLARLGALRTLQWADLTPARLATAVLEAAETESPEIALDLTGAATTAAIVAALVDAATPSTRRSAS